MKSTLVDQGNKQQPAELKGEQAPQGPDQITPAPRIRPDQPLTIQNDPPLKDFLNNRLKKIHPPTGLWDKIMNKISHSNSNNIPMGHEKR